MRTALTIAGSDSGAGAGIQADLKTFAAHGLYGTCAITAVTAQNTCGVSMVEALSADLVTAQIEAVFSDLGAHAAKTGMLATVAIVEAVSATVQALDIPFLVVDPVILASSGERLLDEDGLRALKAELIPLAVVVTPNIPEAETLTGMQVRTVEDQKEAARRIAGLGARSVVVTGGHASSDDITDLLFTGGEFIEFRHRRVPGRHTHGTGCTFSAAIASHLALGVDVRDAVPRAQAFVRDAIARAPALGQGRGPMDHFFKWEITGPASAE
jgi:hydroxymethylpyrimidine/phosphomethylpyrimidine kinase